MKPRKPASAPILKRCPSCGSYVEFYLENQPKNPMKPFWGKCVGCGKRFSLNECYKDLITFKSLGGGAVSNAGKAWTMEECESANFLRDSPCTSVTSVVFLLFCSCAFRRNEFVWFVVKFSVNLHVLRGYLLSSILKLTIAANSESVASSIHTGTKLPECSMMKPPSHAPKNPPIWCVTKTSANRVLTFLG